MYEQPTPVAKQKASVVDFSSLPLDAMEVIVSLVVDVPSDLPPLLQTSKKLNFSTKSATYRILMHVNNITDTVCVHLASSTSFQALHLSHHVPRKANQGDRRFTTTGLTALADSHTTRDSVLSLDLSVYGLDATTYTDEDLRPLCQFTNIHTLNINGSTEITDATLHHMRNLPLEKLGLNLCAITNTGLQLLRDNMPHMRELDVSDCACISDEGLRHISKMINLSSVNLGMCELITDEGLKHLSQSPALRRLDFTGCDLITDEGLRHISSLKLTRLDLCDCGDITDDGLHHVSKITSLRKLDISGAGLITDVGLIHISKIASLKYLDLTYCNMITCWGQHILAQTLPDLRISGIKLARANIV